MTNTQTIPATETDQLKAIKFQWFSEADIEKAKASGKKCCKMCRYDGVPGLVFNALQWVRCWGCGAELKTRLSGGLNGTERN